MASPFRLFRKHMKPLLAVFMCLLIVAWLGGGALTTYMGGSAAGRSGDEHDARSVAVHWDGGRLTNRQLKDLVVRRQILNGFLKQVQMEGERSAYQAGVEPPPLRVQQLLGPETPQQGVEQSVMQTKLFADAARDAGMKVSNDTVVQYLDELGRGNVSRGDMRALLTRTQAGGGRVSIDFLIDALREEMLARNYLNSHQFSFATVTPQQRWKDWLRVNDRVVVEAAAVPAESFQADVKDPTEAEITAFFDKYKTSESGPDLDVLQRFGLELPSPTPGFRIPRKIDLQFVQANYDDYLAKAEAKVTDEEIAKYYEEHKKLFEKADTGLMEDKGPKKDSKKPEAPATKDGAKEGANQAKPADAEKKAAEPDAKKSAVPAGKEATPPAPPAVKEGKSEAAPAEEKKSSYHANPAKNVFRLTAFEQDAEKKDAPADKAGSADSTGDKAADKSAAVSDAKPIPGANSPGAGNPALEAGEPAAPKSPGPAAAAPGKPGASDASKAAPSTTAPPADQKPAKPVQYQPLSEVKDVIRRQLAEGKVAEQLGDLTKDIHGQLETEFDTWFTASSAEAEKQEPPAPPKSLTDLAPIAAKNGLKHGRTGPKSLLEVRDMPLGKSSVADSGRSLLSLLFVSRELDLYQPVTTVDLDGNRYIVMKMNDEPGREPTLAEVRDDVIRAWKKQKSAELAQKHAEELAKKAQDAKQPLANVFAEDQAVKVVRTDPFSELTGGDVSLVNGQFQQQPYRLSQPNEIVAPGPDFLKRVFELKEGQVAVALNHDHSIAYVVRLVEHQPALPELRNAYLAEANTWPGLYNMTQGHAAEVRNSLAHDIIAGANLKWDRDPDKTAQEARDEG